jgi:hypothetical protein
MLLVLKNTPGVHIVRCLQVLAYDDASNAHPEIALLQRAGAGDQLAAR